MRPLTRAEIFSYRSTGPGIGAAAWAAQDAQGGEPGATCEHEADTDFEQDEQPAGEYEQVEQCRQPALATTRKRTTKPNKRVRNMRNSFRVGWAVGPGSPQTSCLRHHSYRPSSSGSL